MKKSTKIMAVCFSAAALAAAAGIMYMNAKAGEKRYACIFDDGKLVQKIDLSNVSNPYKIELAGNVILVEKGQISMIDADCPDKLCIKQGAISDSARPIVCLPNKIVIKLTDDKDDVDIDNFD
ncbi:MAG: NusG domain II-containing protein [Clostridia bacterium]|nr:NusG domain II-containing protein [Clostridia bacterium]